LRRKENFEKCITHIFIKGQNISKKEVTKNEDIGKDYKYV